MKDKDFRKGDIVCHNEYGNGCIKANNNLDHKCVDVEFTEGSGVVMSFFKDGREFVGSKRSSLHHGTWKQVFADVKDVTPVRVVKRWVNLFMFDNKVESSPCYETVDESMLQSKVGSSLRRYVALAVPVEMNEEDLNHE